MNKILTWASGIMFALLCITSHLYLEGLIPGGSLLLVPLVTGSLYAIWIDSFWRKISGDLYTDKHFKELINMLVRHRKDERTLRVILHKISSDDMNGPLRRNYVWAINYLIASEKGKHHLFTVVRALCELTREYSVKLFKDEVKALTKSYALHATNEEFIKLFNEKMMLCFLEVGGCPTWGDIREELLPIFEHVDRDSAEKFLLTVEERFHPQTTPKSEYLQVEEARSQLFLSLRRWLTEREPVLA